MFNNFFFSKSCRLEDNIEKYGKDKGATNDVTIWRIQVACRISKATCPHGHEHAHDPGRTHTHRPILIASPRKQWLPESASVLRYTYIACLVEFETGGS